MSVQGAGRRHACGPYGSRPQKRPQASTAKGERTAARRAGSSATEDGREATGRQPCLQHAIPKRLRGKASAVRMSRESGRVTPAGPAGSVRACAGPGADGTHDNENAAMPLREQGAPGKGGEFEEGPFPAGARARRAGAFEGGTFPRRRNGPPFKNTPLPPMIGDLVRICGQVFAFLRIVGQVGAVADQGRFVRGGGEAVPDARGDAQQAVMVGTPQQQFQ